MIPIDRMKIYNLIVWRTRKVRFVRLKLRLKIAPHLTGMERLQAATKQITPIALLLSPALLHIATSGYRLSKFFENLHSNDIHILRYRIEKKNRTLRK